MTTRAIRILAAAGMAALLGTQAIAQTTGTVDSHVAAAKAAAGTEHVALFEVDLQAGVGPAAGGERAAAGAGARHLALRSR